MSEKYNARLHILVSKEFKDDIKTIAEKRGIDVSDLIRMVLAELIAKEKQQNNLKYVQNCIEEAIQKMNNEQKTDSAG